MAVGCAAAALTVAIVAVGMLVTFAVQMVVGQGNGYEGYYPMKEAFDEGGYEARSSNFKAGVAEHLITESKAILANLK